MDIGVCWQSNVGEIDYVELAEEQGFTHLWAADSQMIWSDCYAALALAAKATRTIQLGTGVAVAGTRPAPVTAAAHASINRIAPGRVFCGIGTGNTAMRIMGHKPIPMREFDAYLGNLRTLMDGDEAQLEYRGKIAPTRHLMPDVGFVRFTPRMPLYVSGFGAKAMGLAAKHGDGLVMSVPPEPAAVQAVWNRLHSAALDIGKTISPSNFMTSTLTTMVVLDEGESPTSRRVIDEAGAFAIVGLHYAYEQYRQLGRRPPDYDPDMWREYVAMIEAIPEERRHLRIHAGHNCWVEPEEEQFLTPELLQRTCMIGTADELVQRLVDLEAAGLSHVMLLPPSDTKAKVLRDVGTKVIPRMKVLTSQEAPSPG
jgi:5,10-methylenetetrahydromethanopterin reductase